MFICPNCGEPVPDDASVCPHCGSDEETGWNPEADYLSVELPEDDEDSSPAPGGAGGVSGAFALFLLLVVLLGIVAFRGPAALASPYTLLGGIVVAVGILAFLRRPKR